MGNHEPQIKEVETETGCAYIYEKEEYYTEQSTSSDQTGD